MHDALREGRVLYDARTDKLEDAGAVRPCYAASLMRVHPARAGMLPSPCGRTLPAPPDSCAVGTCASQYGQL